jgi:uncharacterized membrane protein YhaH (DUF805 family)
MRKFFSFKGRSNRGDLIFVLILTIVITAAVSTADSSARLLLDFVTLAAWWATLATCVKRCHDIGKSGWYTLIPFFILFLLFALGNKGPNQYDSDPGTEEQPGDEQAETID